jgi:uncharacterized membrane protein
VVSSPGPSVVVSKPSTVQPASEATLIKQVFQHFEGPLPPPGALEHYDRTLPGLAERIVVMAEQRHEMARSQATHRRDLEKAVVLSKIGNERLGQVFAFILAAGAIGGGVLLAWNGKETAGVAAIVAALASLVTVFFVGRRKQSKELQRKREPGADPRDA